VARYASAALVEVSRAVVDLRGRLDETLALAQKAIAASANEVEVGGLFVRAQAYVDRAVRDAERHATEIVAEAHATASEIIAGAQREARVVMGQAGSFSPIPPEALEQLERTIDSFSRANKDLSNELAQLNSSLHQDIHATVNSAAGNGNGSKVGTEAEEPYNPWIKAINGSPG